MKRASGAVVAIAALLLSACDGGKESPVVAWSADADAIENPWPSDRLRSGGLAGTPAGYFHRVLPPDDPAFAGARAFLDEALPAIGASGGYSVYAPVVVPVSREVDPAEVTVRMWPAAGGDDVEVTVRWSGALDALLIAPVRPLLQETTYVVAIAGDGVGSSKELRAAIAADDPAVAPLAAAARARGVVADERDLDLVLSFTTQDVASGLQLVQERVDTALGDALLPVYANDPQIPGFTVGVFTTADAAFAPVFSGANARSDDIAVVAQGTWEAYDWRDETTGTFDPDRLSGAETPSKTWVDFRLTIPKGTPPANGWPVVIVSHGVSGDSTEPLQRAYSFAAQGMAVVGLTATSHGYRGSILDFFDFTDVLRVRDEFRQSQAEVIELERLLRNAKAASIAPFDRLDTESVSFFGNSFGGLVGAPVAATSTHLDAVGLTVTGGRISALIEGDSGELLASLFLTAISFPGASDRDDEFLEVLEILAQWALDPADGGALAPYAPPGRAILVQEAIGDTTILNESTAALALAFGAETYDAPADPFTARRARWIWDVADHTTSSKPHDMYWTVAPMRLQMETFLKTDGGVLLGE